MTVARQKATFEGSLLADHSKEEGRRWLVFDIYRVCRERYPTRWSSAIYPWFIFHLRWTRRPSWARQSITLAVMLRPNSAVYPQGHDLCSKPASHRSAIAVLTHSAAPEMLTMPSSLGFDGHSSLNEPCYPLLQHVVEKLPAYVRTHARPEHAWKTWVISRSSVAPRQSMGARSGWR